MGGQTKAKPSLKAQSGTSRANANTGTPPRRGSGYFGTLVSGMGGCAGTHFSDAWMPGLPAYMPPARLEQQVPLVDKNKGHRCIHGVCHSNPKLIQGCRTVWTLIVLSTRSRLIVAFAGMVQVAAFWLQIFCNRHVEHALTVSTISSAFRATSTHSSGYLTRQFVALGCMLFSTVQSADSNSMNSVHLSPTP